MNLMGRGEFLAGPGGGDRAFEENGYIFDLIWLGEQIKDGPLLLLGADQSA